MKLNSIKKKLKTGWNISEYQNIDIERTIYY